MNNKHIEELLDQALKEYEELEEKINKAIDKIYKIIESNNSGLSKPEYTIVSKHKLLELNINECKELLKILGDKEK